MRRAAFLTIAAFVSAPGGAVLAQDVTLSKVVRSGAPLVLAYERAWDHSCAAVAAAVSITQQPEHGSVSVVRASSAIPASTPRTGSTGPCAGRPVVGNRIVYRSQPGFHGQDHVSWTATYANGGGGAASADIVVR